MKKRGFTLVEILVVISVLSLMGTLILTIFTRTLKGNNKSQIVLAIKQSGQSVIDQLDKIIRGADKVTCTSTDKFTIVVEKNGKYTRIKITPQHALTANGKIEMDVPRSPKNERSKYYDPAETPNFAQQVCSDPMGIDTEDNALVTLLTDTNPGSGVSIKGGFFKKTRAGSFKEVVEIELTIGAGVEAPASVAGQIEPVVFRTSIQLR